MEKNQGENVGPSDRRESPRFPHRVNITIYDLSDNIIDFKSQVHNVSEKGFCIESAANFNPDDCFRFSVDIPKVGLVTGVARACWSKPLQNSQSRLCGIQILSMLQEELHRFRQLIRSLNPIKK